MKRKLCDHAREHLSPYMTARDAPHRDKLKLNPLRKIKYPSRESQVSSEPQTEIIPTQTTKYKKKLIMPQGHPTRI